MGDVFREYELGGWVGELGMKEERGKRKEGRAYLVEFVTEVYRVDVVTLEVGEHDDLRVE